MEGLHFITDETVHKRFAQIDLEEVSKKTDEEMEDLMDILIAESRRNDEKVSLKDFEKELKDEGLI